MIRSDRRPNSSGGQPCLVIAHRGASLEAPENTMAAFRRATKLGADMIELDVQPTRDGHPVVFHDEEVGRTTDGVGLLRQLTLAEVRRLDAGSWFDPAFAGEKVPTLEEVCALAAGTIRLNLEIKCPAVDFPPVAEAVVWCLHEYDLLEIAVLSSFDPAVLEMMRRHSGAVRLAYLRHSLWPRIHLAELDRLGLTALHPHQTLLTRGFLDWAHRRGLTVNVWTVDSPRRAARLIRWGVDGLITNNVAAMVDLIGKHPPTS